MTQNAYERRVESVMSRVVITALPEDHLHEALTLMEENRITVLPIVDSKRHCVGILSASDLIEVARELGDELSDLTHVSDVSRKWLLERLKEHDLGQMPLSKRMTGGVASVTRDASLVHAAREILRHRVHHLPVLDEQRHLVGIISTIDLLGAFVEGAKSG